jgi:hypothetical protein
MAGEAGARTISGRRNHADVVDVRKRMLALVILAAAAIGPMSSSSQEKRGTDRVDRKENALSPDVRKILDKADRFVLLSLDPKATAKQEHKAWDEVFHDYRVRRKLEIRTQETRDQLLGALYKGIADSHGMVAMCFNPRHGIRASMGSENVDLLICFECMSIQIYGKTDGEVLTTGSPATIFNRVLGRTNRQRERGSVSSLGLAPSPFFSSSLKLNGR